MNPMVLVLKFVGNVEKIVMHKSSSLLLEQTSPQY
jgi:hypothetical protein